MQPARLKLRVSWNETTYFDFRCWHHSAISSRESIIWLLSPGKIMIVTRPTSQLVQTASQRLADARRSLTKYFRVRIADCPPCHSADSFRVTTRLKNYWFANLQSTWIRIIGGSETNQCISRWNSRFAAAARTDISGTWHMTNEWCGVSRWCRVNGCMPRTLDEINTWRNPISCG